MQVIFQRIWREPAVAIGFAATVAIGVLNLLTLDVWDVATIIATLMPLASSLGIRELVTPVITPKENA